MTNEPHESVRVQAHRSGMTRHGRVKGGIFIAILLGCGVPLAGSVTANLFLSYRQWMLDGIEICRGIRAEPNLSGLYLILLTARDTQEHVVEGLRAGANDYITKPFHTEELLARVNIGAQTIQLQMELTHRVHELEDALGKVKQLQGLLPICSYCKSVRDDKNYWQRVEDYLATHSELECSHGICPKCWETVVRRQFTDAGIAFPTAPESSPFVL